MTITSVNKVSITGIVSVLPEISCENIDESSSSAREEMARIVASTGIRARRVASADQTALSLGKVACESLIDAMDWKPEEISLVVFVTQTPDYPLPGNAVQLQHQLGLSKDTIAYDVNLGCSGFVYGLWQVAQLVAGLSKGKALLVVGDTTTHQYRQDNRAVSSLFGDAVSAIAIEKCMESDEMVFSLGTDGAGAPYLIQPKGGALCPGESPELFMDGMQVFVFTLREVPSSITACLAAKGWQNADVDYCVMHQANEMMLKRLGDKLGLTHEQLVISMGEVGNTSSASIPLALGLSLSEPLLKGSVNLVLSGFGVGWSWGTVALTLTKLKVCQVIDLSLAQ
ncbi:ketoacyl-ACP synthase III [Shewanella loihica]|uniref:3-oxoacyl-(Acyl-carrier-protein) synthase n=1 Tax=Shewanella loihica (strain ATCC BAA-1088 / PV-4) TaxID=323850 RepID=A3QCK5_SHELP|nr:MULTISPECIES: ketoacyl-ACP synthase III [Shewanella]ABO23203.1 3-oxoacyl-(acyl-carrier-protein) synthase [Shewanella loihica PV-4]QYJ83687.1 ketoacyl-ACP synthase III [Shewanella aegiceratis]